MTQRQILYFRKTYETRNIATAAEELYVSRSVISRALQELEDELKTTLFERSKAGVTPTQAGELFHETILQVTGCFGAFSEKLRYLGDSSTHRKLRIGVTPTNNYTICPLLFGEFQAAFPDIRITVYERYSENLAELLNSGQVDLIISPSSRADYLSLAHQALYRVHNVACMLESHPLAQKSAVTAADLAPMSLGFLGVPPMDMERGFKNAFAGMNVTPDIVLRTSSVELLRDLTQQGRLISILPDDMITAWDHVVGVPVDFLTREVTHRVSWNKAIPLSTAAQDLLTFFKEYFASRPNRTY